MISWLRSVGTELRTFISTYRRALTLLAVIGLATIPWLYKDHPTLFSVATNVFATVLVTPLLMYGIDHTINEAERRRREPRNRAVSWLLRTALGHILAAVTPLPHANLNQRGADRRPIAYRAAEHAVAHWDDVARHFYSRTAEQQQDVVIDLIRHAERIERAVQLSNDLAPEDAAFGVVAVSRIENISRDYFAIEGQPKDDETDTLAIVADLVGELACDVGEMYLKLPVAKAPSGW